MNRANKTNFDENMVKHTAEEIIVQILFILLFIAILFTNTSLLWCLCSLRKKVRETNLLIIQSITDISVGLFSLPLVAWEVFKIPRTVGCSVPCEILIVFHYFPHIFSWMLTIIIAIDRWLVVTKGSKYKNVVTTRKLLKILLALFFFTAGLSVLQLAFTLNVRTIMKVVIEIILILVTIALYLHLLHFMRKRTRIVKPHSGINFSKRLTKTIIWIFFCQVFLTAPQLVYFFIIIPYGTVENLASRIKAKLIYRWMLILRYSNCFTNALLLLHFQYRNRRLKEKVNVAWCIDNSDLNKKVKGRCEEFHCDSSLKY